MMKISKENRKHVIGFSIFTAMLMAWFIYASSTGWRLFAPSGNGQSWSSSGPGYHK